jgi:hypothetical protein
MEDRRLVSKDQRIGTDNDCHGALVSMPLLQWNCHGCRGYQSEENTINKSLESPYRYSFE